MTTPACPSYAGYCFPAEVISHAVRLYFRFPLSLRMVDEFLAARGIVVSHETVRQWAELAEGSAGAASGMVNKGAQVRPGVCQPDPPQAACGRRQVARGIATMPWHRETVPHGPGAGAQNAWREHLRSLRDVIACVDIESSRRGHRSFMMLQSGRCRPAVRTWETARRPDVLVWTCCRS